jgi:Trk K+ transport system NAD-binding subunit
MGISRKENDNYKIYKNPKNDLIITKDDYLIILVDGKSKQELEKTFRQKEGRG